MLFFQWTIISNLEEQKLELKFQACKWEVWGKNRKTKERKASEVQSVQLFLASKVCCKN